MKVALLFWGLTRSLKFTINSINERILNILKKNEIEYDIYMHTYKVNNLYSNKRASEKNINLNFEEYKLLNPKYFIYDDLNIIKKKLGLKNYRCKNDPWKSNYETVDNFILAMYSKMCITNLLENNVLEYQNKNYKFQENVYKEKIEENNLLIKNYIKRLNKINDSIKINEINELNLKINNLKLKNLNLEKDSEEITGEFIYRINNKYDYCLFLRPDVFYINDFNIEFFNLIDDNTICIPNFCIFANFNDRFYLSNYKNTLIYGKLFEEMLDYSKTNELHSETFHYDKIFKKYKLNIKLIKFLFDRVRADNRRICTDHKHNVLKELP